VVFAALTVIIALCGLAVVGIPFLTTMGLAAAGAVLVALLIALTLLAGGVRVRRRPGRPVLPFSRDCAERARDPAPPCTSPSGSPERGGRLGRAAPVPVLMSVATLGVMAIPVTGMHLGLPGAEAQPTSNTARRAYDLTTKHFGAGYNGTLTVVAENVTDPAQANQLAAALGRQPGVASASVSTATGGIALISVVPDTGPRSGDHDLVHHIRDHRAAIEGNTGTHVLVGGDRMNIDISTSSAGVADLPHRPWSAWRSSCYLRLPHHPGPIKSIIGYDADQRDAAGYKRSRRWPRPRRACRPSAAAS